MSTPLRLLILEDRLADAELMLHELGRAGFDPAWQRVETEPDYLAHLDPTLDLILADYHLPQFDGLRALHLLQERGLDIPFLVVSGAISEEVAVECMKQGAADYLLKDRLARLGPAVEHALEQRRLREERRRAQEALAARLRQQAAVAQLGERALAGGELSALFDEAVALVAQALEVEYAKVLELEPDGTALLLRAGAGWRDGYVGHAKVEAGTKSQAGYTLLAGELVVVEDFPTETRFSGPALLREHGVVSGMSVIIHGRDRPFGVLGAHTTRRRSFTQDDRHFLQAIANVLAAAIAREWLEAHLEATVEERTRELQEANRQLRQATRLAEEASRHKSAFLANMSHELRTPLNSILGFSELLQDQAYGELSAKQARYVGHIHQSGQHLLSLINDLLDLSKVEAGKLEMRPESFALPEAIAAALRVIQPQADLKRLQLQLDMAEAPATLTADPVRLKQILYNLLSNGVKFTPEGGQITVTARRGSRGEGLGSSEGSRLDPKPYTLYPGEFVEIAVQDTGIGIKSTDFPKLFQPFTQLALTAAKRYQGTGLGLALTKRLVELHGGTIEAASAGEGQGSIFTVRLPLG